MTKTLNNQIKDGYGIVAKIKDSESPYNKFTEVNVIATNEKKVSVHVATKYGGAGEDFSDFDIHEEITYKADYLLDIMERYIENGDHDGVSSLDLVKLQSENLFRLSITPDDEFTKPIIFKHKEITVLLSNLAPGSGFA